MSHASLSREHDVFLPRVSRDGWQIVMDRIAEAERRKGGTFFAAKFVVAYNCKRCAGDKSGLTEPHAID